MIPPVFRHGVIYNRAKTETRADNPPSTADGSGGNDGVPPRATTTGEYAESAQASVVGADYRKCGDA